MCSCNPQVSYNTHIHDVWNATFTHLHVPKHTSGTICSGDWVDENVPNEQHGILSDVSDDGGVIDDVSWSEWCVQHKTLKFISYQVRNRYLMVLVMLSLIICSIKIRIYSVCTLWLWWFVPHNVHIPPLLRFFLMYLINKDETEHTGQVGNISFPFKHTNHHLSHCFFFFHVHKYLSRYMYNSIVKIGKY